MGRIGTADETDRSDIERDGFPADINRADNVFRGNQWITNSCPFDASIAILLSSIERVRNDGRGLDEVANRLSVIGSQTAHIRARFWLPI